MGDISRMNVQENFTKNPLLTKKFLYFFNFNEIFSILITQFIKCNYEFNYGQ